ncbi:MAG TPA: hypothetical protein DD400_02870 [Rhodospirillaceae bacterium]|nr:hypothetical protein [Rhodospirillaceae bacterium]
MDKLVRFSAYIFNILLLIVFLSLLPEQNLNDPQEFLLMIILAAAPLFSLAALWYGPDIEERRLRKRLAKAELRTKLKKLGEE